MTVASVAGAATVWGVGLLSGAASSGQPSTDPVPAAVGPAPGDLDLAIWFWLLAGLLALVVGLVLSGRRQGPGDRPVVRDPSAAGEGTSP